MRNSDIGRLLAPALAGYGTVALLGTDMAPPKTSAPPSGWVFSAVWPVIYLLLGYSWYETMKCSKGAKDRARVEVAFGAVVLGLCAWLVVHADGRDHARQRSALLVMVATLAALGGAYTLASRRCEEGALALAPVLAWMGFALNLSVGEVNAAAQ